MLKLTLNEYGTIYIFKAMFTIPTYDIYIYMT